MLDTKASSTEVFVANLFADPDLQDCLRGIPEAFISQARDAYDSFYVDTELMSRSQYTKEDGSADLVRIVLEDPFYDEDTDSVSIKVRLSAIMNADGSLEPHRTGSTLKPGQAYVKGMRSLPVKFDATSVQAGVLSQEDFDALVDYALLWEEYEANYGKSCFYTAQYANKRLWVVAANPDGIVTFDMCIRLNPQNNTPTVGIQNVAWSDCKLIGTTTGQTKQPARKASTPVARKSSIELPPVNRATAKPATARRRR